MQRFTAHITWQCPACEHYNEQEVDVPELNFAGEKSRDMAVDDQTEIICDGCELEYFGHVWVDMGSTTFEIEEPHDFTINGDMPMYGPDPDEDYEPPDDPHSIVREALDQLSTMAGTRGPENDPQFVNRLVFSGAVASLEAFLGDTLINAVQNEEQVRADLLKNYTVLGAEKFTAAELAEDPEAITKRIVGRLKDVLFHNLGVATNLYKAAFAITLAPDKDTRDKLFLAMPKRHDCVHRNGRKKDGEKLTDFTDEYVKQTLDAISSVVDHVEDERLKHFPF